MVSGTVHAQKYTISGFLSDSTSGESLIGASVYDIKTLQGTTTNLYGFYSLSLNKGDTVKLGLSYLGYTKIKKTFILKGNLALSFKLKPMTELKEVVVTADKVESIEKRSQMSAMELTSAEIKSLPRFMGEVDVLKAIQLLPGVQSGVEGGTGVYVRGGSPDQNLMLLDGVPIYNASHLFGFFSVFNADAINNVTLLKGGFPARYGGRLSSVIDINMKEGNQNKYRGKIGIGLIASNMMFEGPIQKGKSSFIITARRTYIDILLQPLIRSASDGKGTAGYYFYDVNAKLNYRLGNKDRLFLSFYSGKDKFYATGKDNTSSHESSNEFGLGWGNITSVLRWNHQFAPKLFLNTTVNFSQFQFVTGIKYDDKNLQTNEQSNAEAQYLSGIRDWSLKTDFDYLPSPDHFVKFGTNAIAHRFKPGAFAVKSSGNNSSLDTILGPPNIDAIEMAVYAEDDYKVNDKMKVNIGLHASGFQTEGKFYSSLQPRLSGRYLLGKNWSAKASYSKMSQYIHLLTNTGIGLPTDLWVPSTKNILPEKSWQVAAGAAKTLPWKELELTIEGYYKEMKGVIEYKDGESYLNSSSDWQSKVEAGTGWAYGAEFMVQKKTGKTTGWIAYTLSWSNRQFPNINNGNTFPFHYDQRHNVSFVMNRQLTPHIDFSVTWVYGSGAAVTLPTDQYQGIDASPNNGQFSNSNAIDAIPSRNNYRMGAYHRMDISMNFTKQKKHGLRTWNISVYNVYNRKNPFFLSFNTNNQGEKVLTQYSLFPILPSFSYIYEFN
jgi:hypothetical protein